MIRSHYHGTLSFQLTIHVVIQDAQRQAYRIIPIQRVILKYLALLVKRTIVQIYYAQLLPQTLCP